MLYDIFKNSKLYLTTKKLMKMFLIMLFLQKLKVNFLRKINKNQKMCTKKKNSATLLEWTSL